MSKLWFTSSGKLALCDSGKVGVGDECICGCPDFEGRTITYVDKHAIGTGDGSSWVNAFTDIQTAIDTYPKREIQIQGYGESDTYPAGIVLAECVYLKGVDNVWIDGNNSNIIGINGNSLDTTKLDSINIKGCKNSNFSDCQELINCNIKDTILNVTLDDFGGFLNCQVLDECDADNISNNVSFANCKALNNCVSENSYFGFRNSGISGFDLVNCTATNHTAGAIAGINGVMVGCVAELLTTPIGGAFSTNNCSLTNCLSRNNNNCGYFTGASTSIYISCQDINNCLSGASTCTPSNPSYNCDTV